MNSLQEVYESLSDHKEFDPRAFLGDGKYTQEMCNFILCLSLIFNDLKNTVIFNELLNDNKPGKTFERNARWGEHNGLGWHVIRMQMAIANELLQLIEKHKDIVESDEFNEVIRCAHMSAQDSWQELKKVAQKHEKNELAPLHRIRNQVASHYEMSSIIGAYKNAFFTGNKINEHACLSLGTSISQMRFYFADRVAQELIKERISMRDGFDKKFTKVIEQMVRALYSICTTFVLKRGYVWQDPKN